MPEGDIEERLIDFCYLKDDGKLEEILPSCPVVEIIDAVKTFYYDFDQEGRV